MDKAITMARTKSAPKKSKSTKTTTLVSKQHKLKYSRFTGGTGGVVQVETHTRVPFPGDFKGSVQSDGQRKLQRAMARSQGRKSFPKKGEAFRI
jgi:hypothetical protein